MKKNVFIGMLFCLLLSGYSLKVNAQTADSSARHTLWKSFESAEQWQQTKDTQNNPVEYRGELIPAGIYAYQFEIEYESINASDIRIEFCVQSEGLEKNGLTKIAECNTKDLKGIMTVQVSPWNSFHSFYPVIRTDSSTKITRIDIYKQKCDHLAIITGVIQQRSVIYDPNMFDYPDGGFTLHLKMGGILDGISCKQECVLIQDAFRKKKILKTDEIKNGSKVLIVLCPYEDAPDDKQSILKVDEINLFQLENYYQLSSSILSDEEYENAVHSANVAFESPDQKYTSLFDLHINPPVDERLVQAQKQSIENERKKVSAFLEHYDQNMNDINQKFRESWLAEQAKDPAGYNRIGHKGSIVWRNVDHSFWCLPSHYLPCTKFKWTIPPQHLQALKSLNDALNHNGIQLIIHIVPNLFDMAARVILPSFRHLPDYRSAFIAKQLLDENIEAIYASDLLIKNYNRFPFQFFFPSNSHPSDTCQDVMTEQMAAILERYHFEKNMSPDKFSFPLVPHVYRSDRHYLFPANCDIEDNKPQNAYKCREVLYDNKPMRFNQKSPILVIGNSFIETPMFYESYPKLLASKICFMPQSMRSDGDGPMTLLMQRFLSFPERCLKDKKVVILCLGTEHFFSRSRWLDLKEQDQIKMQKAKENN